MTLPSSYQKSPTMVGEFPLAFGRSRTLFRARDPPEDAFPLLKPRRKDAWFYLTFDKHALL